MLNAHMSEDNEQRLTNIDHTLDLMDFDGSDDLDINEFFEVGWRNLHHTCRSACHLVSYSSLSPIVMWFTTRHFSMTKYYFRIVSTHQLAHTDDH